jgi:hypothetical protein
MTTQTQSVVPSIEWDDSVVFVFSWNNQQFFAGFVHLQIALASAVGTTTQITNILQQLAQTQLQASSDPQSWLDTVKNAARNSKAITITFEDAISTVYTTQTNQSFTIQQLFSIAG